MGALELIHGLWLQTNLDYSEFRKLTEKIGISAKYFFCYCFNLRKNQAFRQINSEANINSRI